MLNSKHHDLERAPTFRELFDRTHKRKGTDDYVTESARTIAVSQALNYEFNYDIKVICFQ